MKLYRGSPAGSRPGSSLDLVVIQRDNGSQKFFDIRDKQIEIIDLMNRVVRCGSSENQAKARKEGNLICHL